MSDFKDEYRWFEITVFDTRYKLYNTTENYVMYAASIDEAKKKIDSWHKSR